MDSADLFKEVVAPKCHGLKLVYDESGVWTLEIDWREEWQERRSTFDSKDGPQDLAHQVENCLL